MNISDEDKIELGILITQWLERKQFLSADEAISVDLRVVKQGRVKVNVIQQGVDPSILAEIAKRPISDLHISHQSAEAGLREREIHTIGDILKHGKRDLFKARNLGLKSFREIREKLRNLGFKLGREWMVRRHEKGWIPDPSTTVIE